MRPGLSWRWTPFLSTAISLPRTITIGAAAGAVAGIAVGGIGGRLAMWLVALTSSSTPNFSAEATLQLLLQVTYRGIAVGILYVPFRERLPGPTPRRGVTFGIALLLVMLVFVFATNWGHEFSQQPILVGLLAFGGVFFLFALALEAAVASLNDILPPASRNAIWLGSYLALAAAGLVTGVLGLLTIVAKDLFAGG